MKSTSTANRRQFLQSAALASAVSAVPALGAAAKPKRFIPPGFKPGQIKLGNVCWNYGGIIKGYPFDKAIDQTAGLGFDAIELIIGEAVDLKDYWLQPSTIPNMKKKLDSHNLAVSQFVLFQSAVENLSSLNSDDRNRSLDVFEEGCKIGRTLNAPFINIVSPWPREMTGPHAYLPRYFAESGAGKKFHIDIAEGFDYDQVWDTFVHTMKGCVERAAHHGLRFTIENHTHTLVHDSTAFLRLWDHIKDPRLGMNLDIGWIQLQREYPPMAILKVKDHLMNAHIRDIDSEGLVFVGIGEGVMDFKAVVKTLRDIEYTGYLTFEQDGVPDMQKTLRYGKKMLQELLG